MRILPESSKIFHITNEFGGNMNNQTTIYNEKTFYPTFIDEMLKAEKEVVIYSPFISRFRANFFKKAMTKLDKKGVKLIIFTRPVNEHEEYIREEVKAALKVYEDLGAIIIFLEGSIHEKVAIIDRQILWTGSMNILSQRSSKEFMTRTEDQEFTNQVISHLKLVDKISSARAKQRRHSPSATSSIIGMLLAAIRQTMIILVRTVLGIFKVISVILG